MARAKDYERQDFLERMAKIAAEMRRQIEAEVDGFSPDPLAAEERRRRAATDVLYFGQTYFPHKVSGVPSKFHRDFTTAMAASVATKKGVRELWKAPRGNAKTTWGEIFVTWCVVHKKKHFAVFLSDSLDQACSMLEAVKAELDTNPRLQNDFPDARGEGPVWQYTEVTTAQGIKLKAGGARKKLRGMRHGAYRPDLVWCDDLENDINVKSPEQRDGLEGWLDKAVEPLGPPDDSMDLWYVGTVLHHDAVIARKARNALWRAHAYQAIITWPTRMDLWEKWEAILNNGDRETAEAKAEAFYLANRRSMDAGAAVLWPEVQPLYTLMLKRYRIKDAAFQSEYQNDPRNSEDAVFQQLQYWPGLVSILRQWHHYGSLDPSLGKQNKSRDPSALLVGAVDEDGGRLCVVEARIRRRVPDKIISDVIALQQAYACLKWAVETVQFQEFLRTELIARSIAAGCPVPAIAVHPHADKGARIESIQPYVDDGRILLHPDQRVLIDQMLHFPNGDHDDGPDALEMLWQLAMRRTAAAGANGGSETRQDEPQSADQRSAMDTLRQRFGGGPRRVMNLLRRR